MKQHRKEVVLQNGSHIYFTSNGNSVFQNRQNFIEVWADECTWKYPSWIWPVPQMSDAELRVRRAVAANMGMEYVEPMFGAGKRSWLDADFTILEERAMSHLEPHRPNKADMYAYYYGQVMQETAKAEIDAYGRIHGTFNDTGTVTGRFSHRRPSPVRDIAGNV